MVGERLDRLPISRWHHRILWLISLGLFFDCFDIWLAGSVIAVLLKTGFSNIQSNSVFLSVTSLGLLIGALYGGILGDRYGRKFSYQFNLLVFGIGSIAAALAPNMTLLIIFRGIMGLGLGAEVVIGYSSLGEFIPARVRGKWTATASMVANCSLALSAMLAVYIVPISWRYMFVIVGVGAVAIWYARHALPESPRWLESKGRYQEAEDLVSSIEKEVEKEQDISLSPVTASTTSSALPQPVQLPYWRMFTGKILQRTIAAILMFAGQSVAQGVFMTWLPVILMKQGINLSHSLAYTAVMSCGAPAGAFLGMLIIDHFSRKQLTIVAALGTAITGYLYGTQTNIVGLLTVGFLFFVFMFLHNAVAYTTFIAEMFPTNIRLRAYGFCNIVGGRLVSMLAPFWAAYILIRFGSPKYVYLTVMVVFVIEAICVILLAPETRNKKLEEIEDELDITGKRPHPVAG